MFFNTSINPITRIYIYLLFSISIILSRDIQVLFIHFIILLAIFYIKRYLISTFKNKIKPYLLFFLLGSLIFFFISLILSERSISVIIFDIFLATLRLILMTSVMILYVLEHQSINLLTAVRSLWYTFGLNIKWVDRLILLLELTYRFFPLMQQKWYFTQKSQKALSISTTTNQMEKIIKYSNYLPDFIILNLYISEKIVENMLIRGFGSNKRRSTYPFLSFNPENGFLCIFLFFIIFGIHHYV